MIVQVGICEGLNVKSIFSILQNAAEPEQAAPKEEPAVVTYHPAAPEAPPTASPIYYKTVEVPAPETAPEPVYQPEAPPQEPEPTPSPIYYKTPDSPTPPPAAPEGASAEYDDKQKTVGENEFGFPSQNFVNQENFKIPEFFRTFLNTPPKWINMNNW